jgi:hypothetical protein
MSQVIKYSELVEYMKQVNALSKNAQRDLSRIWGQLSHMSIDDARDVLILSMTGLIGEYGDAAALMTAEFMSRYSPTLTRFEYVLSEGASAEQIEKRVRSAMRFWAKDMPESTIKELYGSLDRYIKYPGRQTVIETAKTHKKLRFAIVPRAGCICKWCLMLASRGFVYWSKDTTHASLHSNCNCAVVQGWAYPDGSHTKVEGYEPDMLERRWRQIENGNMTFEKGAVPYDKELDVGVFLAEDGHKVRFLKEVRNKRMADTLVDGVLREFKIPEGNKSRNTNWRTNAMTQLESVLYDSRGKLKPQSLNALVSTHKTSGQIEADDYGRYLVEAWKLPKCSMLEDLWLVDVDGIIHKLSK